MIRKVGLTARMKRATWMVFAPPLIFAVISGGCGNAPVKNMDEPANAPSVADVKVARQDLTSTLEIASEFQPFQQIEVYAKVSGYVQKSYVDWGMHVKQGQLLAVLEMPSFNNSFSRMKQPFAAAASKGWKARGKN